MKNFLTAVLVLSALWSATSSSVFADTDGEAGGKHPGWSFNEAAHIPIQSGGRIKPMDTYARELMIFMTGSRFYDGWHPVDLILSMMTYPKYWVDRAFIVISIKDVRRQLGVDEERTYFSPNELLQKSYLIQYAQRVNQLSANPKAKLEERDQELKRVFDRVGLFRNVVSGEAWPVIPTQAPTTWRNLSDTGKDGEDIRQSYKKMVLAYRAGDPQGFQEASLEAQKIVQRQIAEWSPVMAGQNNAEVFYNHLHPFLAAWVIYLLAALLWFLSMSGATTGKGVLAGMEKIVKGSALAMTIFGMALHIVGIGLRCYVAGRPPVSNMYESVIWVSLGVMVFGMVLYAMNKKQAILLSVGCSVATFALVLADSAPAMMDPSIHPLVPVLRSNYWLTIHVLTITLSYAAFALALGIANVTLFQYYKKAWTKATAGMSAKILGLDLLTYRAVQFGVVLLAAGTILGGVWADYSWGRFWGWDAKEVWALTALLGYLAVLHARYTGWIGQFGFAVCAVCSFLGVVMAWYGVNFVLARGLHSYGFSTGGRGWVAAFILAQLLYVAGAADFDRGGTAFKLLKGKKA